MHEPTNQIRVPYFALRLKSLQAAALAERLRLEEVRLRPLGDLPEIMTAEEACQYLRLDVGRSMPLALKALARLVDEKQVLTPTMYLKRRMFTRAECDRMAEKMTKKR